MKNAEGALKRTIDHQIVNEYRGAISALNSGAPFMFTKADRCWAGRCSTSPASSTAAHADVAAGDRGAPPDRSRAVGPPDPGNSQLSGS